MPITPNSSVFTALSLTDIARPLPRTAAQGVRRPAVDAGHVETGQGRRQPVENGGKPREAAGRNTAETPENGNAPRQQVAEDFRREAVTPRRPAFQKLGQFVDLSV